MRRISRCLNVKLTDICKQSIQLEALSQTVNQYLPLSLREQCHVGSFNKGCLVLITHHAGWASQLRYALPELRDSLRSAGIYQLVSIKISVSTEAKLAALKKEHQSISSKARQSIAESAEECLYAPLRQALYRLARDKETKDPQDNASAKTPVNIGD